MAGEAESTDPTLNPTDAGPTTEPAAPAAPAEPSMEDRMAALEAQSKTLGEIKELLSEYLSKERASCPMAGREGAQAPPESYTQPSAPTDDLDERERRLVAIASEQAASAHREELAKVKAQLARNQQMLAQGELRRQIAELEVEIGDKQLLHGVIIPELKRRLQSEPGLIAAGLKDVAKSIALEHFMAKKAQDQRAAEKAVEQKRAASMGLPPMPVGRRSPEEGALDLESLVKAELAKDGFAFGSDGLEATNRQ